MPNLRALPVGLAALVCALAAPGAASAATTLGQNPSAAPSSTCAANAYTVLGLGGTDIAPSAGIITSFKSTFAGATGTVFAYRIFRPNGGSTFTGIGSQTATIDDAGNASTPARIAVQTGDHIGISKDAGGSLNCVFTGSSTYFANSGNTPDNQPLDTSGTTSPGSVNVLATLEADADGDGYGDETQDACPADPQRHADCAADLQVTQQASLPTIAPGGLEVLSMKVTNASAGPADEVQVTEAMPAGVSLVAVGGADCGPGNVVSCSVGTLAGGTSRQVVAVVRPAGAGAIAMTASAVTATPDPDPSNNSATTTFTSAFAAAQAFCRVPKLKGLSKSIAKLVLKAGGCALGKTTKPKNTHGKTTVSKQSLAANTVQALGTKVDVTLKGTTPKKKTTKKKS